MEKSRFTGWFPNPKNCSRFIGHEQSEILDSQKFLKTELKMSQYAKSVSAAAWREKVNQRCSLLDRRLIVRDHQNIISFEINFPKEGFFICSCRTVRPCGPCIAGRKKASLEFSEKTEGDRRYGRK